MPTFEAIFFPANDRSPTTVPLLTSNFVFQGPAAHEPPYRAGRLPHPEIHMDYIADRSWEYHTVSALDGMSTGFQSPYIVFYPVRSRDGMPFPVNKCVREIQGGAFVDRFPWRGDLVVAKYRDANFSEMTDASMADFPIIKNYLSTKPGPRAQQPQS
ncbi:uncharacterized protein BXZ73DRAFT_97072 [Epithele typhae]|uniref:uncharacterized protein n=1 Tax=Epithele typhae TaxID=378194 RepID=UPI0020083FAB|nr:uncharacterized protein BXZ73DRAFT_97072 [Epithele typhae]KAH9943006.1 hypothetical protein BXZ73DRAFT_97072 [Epithele typhae]